MNAIQKTTFAASSLAITLIGAAFVTAPLAFTRAVPGVTHGDCSVSSVQLAPSGHVGCADVSRNAPLTAFNRR